MVSSNRPGAGLLKRFLSITDKPQSGTVYSIRAATENSRPGHALCGKPGRLGPFHLVDPRGTIRPARQHPLFRSIFLTGTKANPFSRRFSEAAEASRAKTFAHSETGILVSFRFPLPELPEVKKPWFAHSVRWFRDAAYDCVHVLHPIAVKTAGSGPIFPDSRKVKVFERSSAKGKYVLLLLDRGLLTMHFRLDGQPRLVFECEGIFESALTGQKAGVHVDIALEN